MIITAGILYYLISRNHSIHQYRYGADMCELSHSESAFSGLLRPGVIYLLEHNEASLAAVSSSELEISSDELKGLLCKEHTDRKYEEILSLASIDLPPHDASHCINDMMLYFLNEQNQLLEKIMKNCKADEILERASKFTGLSFSVVSRDMLIMYETPLVRKQHMHIRPERYDDEIMEELLMSRSFHEAAGKKEGFYYYMSDPSQKSYCHNIFLDGAYFARLIVFIPGEERTLPRGAEQLAAYLTKLCVMLADSGILRLHRHQHDQMHNVFRRTVSDGSVPSAELVQAQLSYGWKEKDRLQLTALRVFNDQGWNTQFETSLPVVLRKLEELVPESCAVSDSKDIFWLVNLTAAEKRNRDFMSQLNFFIRENICKAGLSPTMDTISGLASAVTLATYAIDCGSKKYPDYWLYRFEDLRTDFVMDAVKKRCPDISLLIHPALRILSEYDRAHESSLIHTLSVYLDSKMNTTLAAERLFVHRTTLFRRLETISRLTSIDLEEPGTVFFLQLSFRLLR